MKKLKVPIGILIETMAEFNRVNLQNHIEQSVSDLSVKIETPSGPQIINHVIRKDNLHGRKFTFNDGTKLHCAAGHILFVDGIDRQASTFDVGDVIDCVNGNKKIVDIAIVENNSYYDIAIDHPHKYIDANGIIHHNTLMTAALSLMTERYGKSVVIVPNKDLVKQTEADYINLGLDVGVYFGDRKEVGRTHTICTWQSLNVLLKNSEGRNIEDEPSSFRLLKDKTDFIIDDLTDGVALVMVDEVHMAKADALKTLLTGVFARVPIRWGLTGTVPKEDYAKTSIFCGIGPVIGKLSASELQEAGHLAQCHVNIVQLLDFVDYKDYQSELKYLVTNTDRLAYIARLIEKIKDTGNTLILVDRIETGKYLQVELSNLMSLLGDKPDVPFISGNVKSADRKEEYDDVATASNKIIVATYGVAAVGLNIPRIFNLVMLESGKSFTRVIQSIGRGIRKAQDKDHVEIWDITSNAKFAKRHLTQRKAFYNEANYPFTIEKVDWKKKP